jgi:hypothetical protein
VQKNLAKVNSQRDLGLALAAFLIAVVLWQVQGLGVLLYPFRLFVTMIHEMGHGTAAILTGGSFLRFEVSKQGAGLAYTSGGARFVIIQAGYLGSALFGAALLYVTNRVKQPKYVAVGLGVLIGLLTLLYSDLSFGNLSLPETVIAAGVIITGLVLFLTQETDQGRYIGAGVTVIGGFLGLHFAGANNTWTILVGLASAFALISLGYWGSREIVLVTLTFLAFLTGLQAITDAWVLLKVVSLPNSMVPHNDARSMAQAYPGSAAMWALIWIALDVLIFGTSVYLTYFRRARPGA